MLIAILFLQGLFEMIGFCSFIAGYFIPIKWLMVLGGCLVVLDDVIEIKMGVLNPLVPLLLSIGLAIVFSPWYIGIFWASAAFKVLGMPVSLMKVFTPRRFSNYATRSVTRRLF